MRIAAHPASLLAVLLVAGVARSEEPSNPWWSKEVLEKRLGEACDAVEKACGAAFTKRPTVRISKPGEVEDLVRDELTPLLRAAGREESVEATVAVVREAIVAKYDPRSHAIHVVPDNVERNAERTHEPRVATEDGLRAILAHEATHALDFERFPLLASRSDTASLDELEAWAAVVEGHAQLVAQQVATADGFAEAFEAFTRSVTALPDLPDEASRTIARAATARVAFAYVAGLDFMRAVHAARGREGVESALREPPRSRRAIENPAEWLEPSGRKPTPDDHDEGRKPTLDVHGALGALSPWFEDPSWALETDDVLRTVFATQLASQKRERAAALSAGFESGAVVLAVDPPADARVMAAVFAFRTPELAAEFVAVERAANESRDAAGIGGARVVEPKYSEGAGSGGKRPGFVAEKTIQLGDQRIATVSHFCVADRAVIEVSVIGDAPIDRARQDAGVDAVAAVLEGAAPAPKRLERREPEPPPPPFPGDDRHANLPKLRVLVVGPDGTPVPRARVRIRVGVPGRPGAESAWTDADGGRVTVPLLRGDATVSVDRLRGTDGAPLDLAPKRNVPVPDGTRELTVELERALSIEGTVVGPDGQPLANVVVEVSEDGRSSLDEGDDSFAARSREDGAFRLSGVGPEEVELVTQAIPGFAPGRPVRAKGGATGVTVAMTEATEVRLHIADPGGKPVFRAKVTVWRVTVSGQTTSWDPVATAWTDSSGDAHIPALAATDRYDLSIEANAADLVPIKLVRWTPASGTHTLPPGFTVEGTVRDEAGEAVAGARVSVGNRFTRTGPDGRFRMYGCPVGSVEVRLPAREGGGAIVDRATATPEKPDVTLTMRPKAVEPETVEVEVVEEEEEAKPLAPK